MISHHSMSDNLWQWFHHCHCGRRRNLHVLRLDLCSLLSACVLSTGHAIKAKWEFTHESTLSAAQAPAACLFSGQRARQSGPKLVSLEIIHVKQWFAGKWQVRKGKLWRLPIKWQPQRTRWVEWKQGWQQQRVFIQLPTGSVRQTEPEIQSWENITHDTQAGPWKTSALLLTHAGPHIIFFFPEAFGTHRHFTQMASGGNCPLWWWEISPDSLKLNRFVLNRAHLSHLEREKG